MTELRPAPVAQTRERILDGLADVVVDRGLGAFTVQHVLTAAGVSRRTFYQYYDNLDAALVALHQRVSDTLMAALIGAVVQTEEPRDKVLRGAEAYLDQQLAGGPLLWALQREAARPGSVLNPTHEQILSQFVAFLVVQIRAVLQVEVDPLVFRGILLGVQGVVLHLQRNDTFARRDRDRVAASLGPLLVRLLGSASAWAGRGEPRD